MHIFNLRSKKQRNGDYFSNNEVLKGEALILALLGDQIEHSVAERTVESEIRLRENLSTIRNAQDHRRIRELKE